MHFPIYRFRHFITALLVGVGFLQLDLRPALAGGGHSGGGVGIFLQDGSVRLVDGIADADLAALSIDALDSKDVPALIYAKDRYVKQANFPAPGFFECALVKLKALAGLKAIDRALGAKLPNVAETELFLLLADTTIPLENIGPNIPVVASASSRIDRTKQMGLASFVNGNVWVQKRLLARMSADDRCGLAIHEWFRQLNFQDILKTPLSTDEIEDVTGALMRGDSERIAAFKERLNQVAPTPEETADAILARKLQIAKQMQAMADTVVADWPLEKIQEFNKKYSELSLEGLRLDRGIDHAQYELLRPTVSGAGGNALIEQVLLNVGLSTPLAGSKYIDLKEGKIVRRGF